MRVLLWDLWKRRLIYEHFWNYGECERLEGNRVWDVRAETTARQEVRLGLCVMRGEMWEVRWGVCERWEGKRIKKEKSEKLVFNISQGENTRFNRIAKMPPHVFPLISIILWCKCYMVLGISIMCLYQLM